MSDNAVAENVAPVVDQAPPAPAPDAAVAAVEEGEEGFEGSIFEAFEELEVDVEKRHAHVSSSNFANKLQNRISVAVRDELKDNLYPILKAAVLYCKELSDRFEGLDEDFDVVKDVVAELRRSSDHQRLAIREIVTQGVLGAAAMLAKLTLERSQDPELRGVAQAIMQSLGPLADQLLVPAQPANAATESAVQTQQDPPKTA